MTKTIITILISTIAIASTSYAGITMEWEADLTDYTTSFVEADSKHYSDGSVGVAISTSISSNILVVFNSDGSVKFQDSFAGDYWVYLKGLSSNPNHIFMGCGQRNSPWNKFFRIYEVHDNSFTITNTPTVSENFLATDSNAGISSSEFFIVEGTMLRKYQLSSTPPMLDSTVASGIDGSNFLLSWNSKVGIPYQIQSSGTLTNWVDVGSILTGTGDPMTWANALTNSQRFFRVIEK